MPPIHAATACLPGVRYEDAAAIISCGVTEPAIGRLLTAHVQLCPQNFGVMDVALAESLRDRYLDTRFRLHANLRVPFYGNPRWDASHFRIDRRGYFEAMGKASRALGAPAYSLHAGYRSECELPKLRDNVLAIQDLFGVPVALEGMYPARNDPYLVSSLDEYAWLRDCGLYFALDLSHLAIVAHRARVEPLDLATEMVCHPRCIEIHVSDNDGRGDQHEVLARHPWWWPVLERAARENPDVVVFSEGNQLRGLDREGRRARIAELVTAANAASPTHG